MNIPEDIIESTIRISWGPIINEDDFAKSIQKLIYTAERLSI